MSVLMAGVDESTRGGMWTVVENYLNTPAFTERNQLVYVPTSITKCSAWKKLLFTAKGFLRIRQLYKENDFSIVHVHMSERMSITRKRVILRYAQRNGSKTVIHMHGAEFEMLYQEMTEKRKAYVRDTLNLADRIIVLGSQNKVFIDSLVNDPDRVRVVYNAVKVPESYLYSKNNKVVLFLGILSERKGILDLLNALKLKEHTLKEQTHVCLYGEDAIGGIEQELHKCGLSDWVHYCGWLNSKEKEEIFRKTALNVLPSYNEGLPMTILETMAYGIPSITTNVGAISDAVNEKNGVLVEKGNAEAIGEALVRLLSDDELRMNLSRKCYQDAKEMFSLEKHIAEIQEIYDELSQ